MPRWAISVCARSRKNKQEVDWITEQEFFPKTTRSERRLPLNLGKKSYFSLYIHINNTDNLVIEYNDSCTYRIYQIIMSSLFFPSFSTVCPHKTPLSIRNPLQCATI